MPLLRIDRGGELLSHGGMRTYLSSITCAVIVVASGGTSGGIDGGGTDGNAGSDSGDAATSDASNDGSGNDTGAQCPDENGKYSVTFSGQGCGNVATSAPVCITETACTITLATLSTSGNEVSGTTPIGADGSFSGAAIDEGTSQRTGCVATWDTGSSTLTIDCGGTGTSQSCRATLVRTAANCN